MSENPLPRAALAAAFAAALLATACDVKRSDWVRAPKTENPVSPSAVVIGVAPQPSGGPERETPVDGPAVSAGTSELSKSVEQVAMPAPGQPNDHSTLARNPSQKADAVASLGSAAATRDANRGEAPR